MVDYEMIEIDKNEKRGLWTLLVMFFISWGLIKVPVPLIGFISWVALGLIGFSLWRIIDGLLDRINKGNIREKIKKGGFKKDGK